MSKLKIRDLKTKLDHRDGVSQRQLARKFKCTQPYINQIIKKYTKIRCYKKKKIPKREKAQKAKIRTICGRLTRKFKDFQWIIDDESYFTLNHSMINGNDNFYSSNVEETPSSVKFKLKAKFEKNFGLGLLFT